MIKSNWSVLIISICSAIILSFLNSCGDKKNQALIFDYEKTALRATDQAKMKMINAAAHAYTLETGKRPESLQELVTAGYVSETDILDHEGKPLQYSPDTIMPDGGIIKSCGACGATVSPESKVGDRCPFCGVIWGSEEKAGP